MTQANLTQDTPLRLTPEEMVAAVADLAADRKALDIVGLDLRGMIGYADYFVICTGRTDRQTRAIHDAIHEGMKARGILPRRVEGLSEARWILMDYLDVVVHVFTPDTREYYRLEQLWGEAPSLAVEAAPEPYSAVISFGATSFLRLITPGRSITLSDGSTPKLRATAADVAGDQHLGALVHDVGDHQRVQGELAILALALERLQ